MKGAYIQMADRFYELHVAGVTRKLPILNVNDKLASAGFVILGDVELVEKAAAALVKRVPPETEIMVTAETKGIPLVHEMARLMGMPRYAIARKSVKAYMENPIIVEDRSITTKGKQILVLQDEDIHQGLGRTYRKSGRHSDWAHGHPRRRGRHEPQGHRDSREPAAF